MLFYRKKRTTLKPVLLVFSLVIAMLFSSCGGVSEKLGTGIKIFSISLPPYPKSPSITPEKP